MTKLRLAKIEEVDTIMDIINGAKSYLKSQGIDQWQTGYPNEEAIRKDIKTYKGYFVEDTEILGYLCIDFDGEPAYDGLEGEWTSNDSYVVVHRMAMSEKSRGRGISQKTFELVEELAKSKGVYNFRIDTDEANLKMKNILDKNNFTFRGTINFDNSEKIAFDKILK